MSDLATSWADDIDMKEECEVCGRVEDPMVVGGIGGGPGLKLEVCVVSEIPKLVTEFERQYNVPEDPFDEQLWREFLQTHDSWKTLCERCRKARTATQPARGAFTPAIRPPVPAPALSDSPGSDEDTPEESDRSEEAPDKSAIVPADWHDVQIGPVSRELILIWAGLARKRVRRRDEWQDWRDDEEAAGAESRPINE